MSREYTITLDKLPVAWKEEIKRNRGAVRRGMDNAGHYALNYLREASPIDLGTFKESWRKQVHSNGVDLINDAPHAAFVEDGVLPHWPPPEPIKAWIERNQWRLHGIPISPEDVDRLTFLICRKIATEGIPPHNLLKNRQPLFTFLLRREVEKELNG